MVRRASAALSIAAALLACSPDPRTQTMVVVHADPGIEAQAERVVIRVWGGPASEGPTELVEDGLDLPVPGWPVTHAVIPRDHDANRRFRVEVTAHDRGGAALAFARATGGFARGETRMIVLRLYDRCIGVAAADCAEDETCEDGICVRSEPALVPYDPTRTPDAGRADGGPMDAGALDAGPDDAGGMDAGPLGDAGCMLPSECNDGIACTDDICEVGGTCRNIAIDARCSPSGAECVTGATCVLGVGCMDVSAGNGDRCMGGAGVCWCNGCWPLSECGRCAGGSCECLENDCETPACMSVGRCTP